MGIGTITDFDIDELKQSGRILGVQRLSHPRFPDWLSERGRVESLAIGPFRVSDLEICSADYRLLGNEFLSHFDVVLDFPGRAMYLKPGRLLLQPNAIDFDGLSIERHEREYRVVNVSEGSRAASWGILAGDELIQVDAKPVKGLTPVEVRRGLRKARERGLLVVRRNGRDLHVGPKQMAP
jgi:hypothetical protein